jgi:hypothetical protein
MPRLKYWSNLIYICDDPPYLIFLAGSAYPNLNTRSDIGYRYRYNRHIEHYCVRLNSRKEKKRLSIFVLVISVHLFASLLLPELNCQTINFHWLGLGTTVHGTIIGRSLWVYLFCSNLSWSDSILQFCSYGFANGYWNKSRLHDDSRSLFCCATHSHLHTEERKGIVVSMHWENLLFMRLSDDHESAILVWTHLTSIYILLHMLSSSYWCMLYVLLLKNCSNFWTARSATFFTSQHVYHLNWMMKPKQFSMICGWCWEKNQIDGSVHEFVSQATVDMGAGCCFGKH